MDTVLGALGLPDGISSPWPVLSSRGSGQEQPDWDSCLPVSGDWGLFPQESSWGRLPWL